MMKPYQKAPYDADWRWILAVYCMDYYSSQWSRGYRILERLNPRNFSAETMQDLRDSELYDYLVKTYSDSI